jgi:hypothetical protein
MSYLRLPCRYWTQVVLQSEKALNMAAPQQPRPFRAFINYREHDTGRTAFRLFDELERYLVEGQVFVDRKGIRGGEPWKGVLRSEVQNCTVMLVLIGKKWLTIRDRQSGKRRIDMQEDWVRNEIESMRDPNRAKSDSVLPIAVGNSGAPEARKIAIESLNFLSELQAEPLRWHLLRRKQWTEDVSKIAQRLVDLGAKAKPVPSPPPHPIGQQILAGAALLLLLAGSGYASWRFWKEPVSTEQVSEECPAFKLARDAWGEATDAPHRYYAEGLALTALRECNNKQQACELLKTIGRSFGKAETCEVQAK